MMRSTTELLRRPAGDASPAKGRAITTAAEVEKPLSAVTLRTMSDEQSERDRRLAEQLRANLRRRKQAARKAAKPNKGTAAADKP